MAYTTIDKPSDYFNTVLYTGNGSTQSITGVGFQPDWTWIKRRDGGTTSHQLFDAVRGVTKRIFSDTTAAESTDANTLTAFGTDGFTVGSNTGVNPSGNGVVAWNWLADNTSGSSNSDGSITSTVSANTTSGFSIVSYTGNNTAGATVGHGLSQEPDVMIFKNRSDGTTSWCVYHSAKGTSATGRLNTSNSFGDTTFITTTPSSSVFTLTNTTIVNGSGNNMIAYCFAEKKGFSKFGSYTGNGSTDGTFVYIGFKPAFVIIKKTSGTGNWCLFDNKRGVNGAMIQLNPDNSNADNTLDYIDFLSNGFKCRNTASDKNASGGTYIYIAFAENPFVTSTGIPGLAR